MYTFWAIFWPQHGGNCFEAHGIFHQHHPKNTHVVFAVILHCFRAYAPIFRFLHSNHMMRVKKDENGAFGGKQGGNQAKRHVGTRGRW